MTSANCGSILKVSCVLLGLFVLTGAAASDADDVTTLLQDFLAAAHKQGAHQTFWADDLVYTSSNGTRFGKDEILAGFTGEQASDEPPSVVYAAADIDVRVFGSTAIVAFRLIGTPDDGSAVLEYFNTGTFLKREGIWQVVAWQATSVARPNDGTG